jgi:hypothetical protein
MLKQKIVKMIFCDENGQMIKDRNVDLNTVGRIMSENGLSITPQINENMCSVLEAFGAIGYTERTSMVQEKLDDKKGMVKKEQEPKLVEITEKLVSYEDFIMALNTIGKFDVELGRLGYLKSVRLEQEIK